MKEHLITAAKGAVIGGTMLIPGVSGGTMAMMLSIYDRLINAVSEFFRHKRESFLFLLIFCLGAGAGMLLIAKPLFRVLDAFPLPAGYFFMGAVAGSVPMIYHKARAASFHWRDPVYVAAGMAMVFLLSYLPADHAEKPLKWRGFCTPKCVECRHIFVVLLTVYQPRRLTNGVPHSIIKNRGCSSQKEIKA